jgi:hypothetical protein
MFSRRVSNIKKNHLILASLWVFDDLIIKRDPGGTTWCCRKISNIKEPTSSLTVSGF